jgi:hypothetical protein
MYSLSNSCVILAVCPANFLGCNYTHTSGAHRLSSLPMRSLHSLKSGRLTGAINQQSCINAYLHKL